MVQREARSKELEINKLAIDAWDLEAVALAVAQTSFAQQFLFPLLQR